MAKGKMGRFIVVNPSAIRELVHHDMEQGEREVGAALKMMGDTLVPEADVTVHVRLVEKEPRPDIESFVEAHAHDYSQVCCILGNLKVEWVLDEEKFIASSPAAVFIPPGVKHTWRPLSGTGYQVVILRTGKYE